MRGLSTTREMTLPSKAASLDLNIRPNRGGTDPDEGSCTDGDSSAVHPSSLVGAHIPSLVELCLSLAETFDWLSGAADRTDFPLVFRFIGGWEFH